MCLSDCTAASAVPGKSAMKMPMQCRRTTQRDNDKEKRKDIDEKKAKIETRKKTKPNTGQGSVLRKGRWGWGAQAAQGPGSTYS